MKTLTMLLALVLGAPAFAQETPPKPATPEKPVEKPDTRPEAKPDAEKPAPKKEMSEGGTKLYEDVERIYAKYYELVLDATKKDKDYDADETWNTAVKEAKNAVYKDNKEFFDAFAKMQKTDKVFKEKSTKLVNDLAAAHAKAINDWLDKTDEKPKDK
ncbi:MAG: hypothetical protein IT462_10685 [Planctomycetes bacterium]|nr:hypothetical protein [Planctomycetota bacterium]